MTRINSGRRRVLLFVGGTIRNGVYTQRIDHYGVLRTLEELYDLPHLGHSAQRRPITGILRELVRC